MPNHIEPCPICNQKNSRLVKLFPSSWNYFLKDYFKESHPDWEIEQGLCSRCLDQVLAHYVSLATEAFRGDGSPGEIHGYKVLPTPSRLLAHPDLTGKGVTMCFIDSGFFPHPDLVYPVFRILHWENIAEPGKKTSFSDKPKARNWHGTMTAVVAAGSGYLSGGFYCGVARDADLVLLGVADDDGVIERETIIKALEWVLDNRRRFNIKVINISVSADKPLPEEESPISQAIKKLRELGVVVVAAAGNQPGDPLYPPASSPSALTVGGLDDRNTIPMDDILYPSTYGVTADEYWKPELIAPAIWLAGPILPGTPQQEEAAALFNIWSSEDWNIKAVLANNLPKVKLEKSLLEEEPVRIREAIGKRITGANYISPHYKHVDGTSFAAPIVSSIIAQLLEANPELSPEDIREILIQTARPLPGVPLYKQGYGVVHPLYAAGYALGEEGTPFPPFSPVIDYENNTITFYYHDHHAETVALSGNFNDWLEEGLSLAEKEEGHWSVQMDMLSPGDYMYKYIIDGKRWVTDPRNLFRVPDGHEGFNSKFEVSPTGSRT